ncbi:hypothetical protein NQ314_004465 [Rhamnusium bicolor]|uniref:BZIP domain-containing protein n=1 Tax=Rhamnusium bicolor TaxID=1586634 RepID=A0AAV8ZMP4_9CUCU|nr:hypothetical protein NQ314_004465 [Rhamnusium bicolor]
MLTTDDLLGLDSYAFKSSPESCSDLSYSTDYMDVTSDEDFLTQLSSDLDIPLLLNPGEDEMSMLNSFFDKSPEEILSDVASPPYSKEEELSKEINELQQMDFSQWGPDAFPNLQSEVKLENSDSSSSTESIKFSPIRTTNSPIGNIVKDEIEIKSPPASPSSGNSVLITTTVGGFTSTPSKIVYAQAVQVVPQNQTISKLPPKRVPIIPKTPYTIPVSKSNKVVVIKNSDFQINSPVVTSPKNVVSSPNVVVLENIRTVPINKVTSLPQIPSATHVPVTTVANITQSVTMPSVVISGSNSFSNIDPKLLKRQQRKIKNRESACLSRKKKKDYLTSLEDKVRGVDNREHEIASINTRENSQLKERLAQYEENAPSQNQKVKKNIKQSIVLCVFLLLVGVNLDFIRNPFSTKNQLDLIKSDTTKVFAPTLEQLYTEFFEAINRQDDTFYVVSFTDQHLLLPALHHNKTRRPKMSLIMPSMLPNGTVTQSSLIPLMQIDCEVLDTRLIHIKHGAIPQHLRTYGNTTKQEPSSDSNVSNSSSSEAKYYKEPYKPYFINKNSLKPNGGFYNLH